MVASGGWHHSLWQRCKDQWRHPSDTARHYHHVAVAALFFVTAQLLTCAWNQPFWACNLDFPGQILAMMFVWVIMWTVQVVFFKPGQGLERFYHEHLRPPTEVLNKHMSIGFTVPFLNLIGQSFAGADQVGLLTAAFVVTGLLNAVLVYVVTYNIQYGSTKLLKVLARLRPQEQQQQQHHQQSSEHVLVDASGPSQSCLDRFRKHISDVSTLCTLSGYASDSNSSGPTAGRPEDALRVLEVGTGGGEAAAVVVAEAGAGGDNNSTHHNTSKSSPSHGSLLLHQLAGWVQHNIFLTLSILLFLVIGLPLSCLHQSDLCLDTGFLFTIWLTFTTAQTKVKHHITLHRRRHSHFHPLPLPKRPFLTALATLLNPVLWTSLSLLCYGLAKSHIQHTAPATIVARFVTNTTLADLLAHRTSTSSSIGAGDLATSLLNAGIVSWGLKLFEYRAQVASRAGLTVLLTSALAAAGNIVAWPLLVARLGVAPAAADLSFAARSVTIALGGPAMTSLGGDAGVNAVGVVVNGICFQLVAGLFVDVRGGFTGVVRRWVLRLEHADDGDDRDGKEEGGGTATPGTQTGSASASPAAEQEEDAADVHTVAAGVTIGINAAAMGTAHLYEQNSAAAPYSALSMTMLGVFTVLFTVQSPMVDWLVGMVSQ